MNNNPSLGKKWAKNIELKYVSFNPIIEVNQYSKTLNLPISIVENKAHIADKPLNTETTIEKILQCLFLRLTNSKMVGKPTIINVPRNEVKVLFITYKIKGLEIESTRGIIVKISKRTLSTYKQTPESNNIFLAFFILTIPF